MEFSSISFLSILAGTWFVVSSNFPMWLRGNKTNPRFTYTVQEKKGEPVLLDVVSYTKNNKTKTITGIDYPDAEKERAFTWRGKGLLRLAKSKWEIRLMDPNAQWMVIYFSKTAFTPEGVDIVSRSTKMDAQTLEDIYAVMRTDSILARHLPALKPIAQSPIKP